MIKTVRLSCDLKFLNECRKNNVVPIFLQFNVANEMLLYSNAYKQCQRILLNEEINLKKKNIKYLSKSRRDAYNELVNIFPLEIITEINQIISSLQIEEQHEKYFTHYKKLNGLILKRNQQQQQQQQQRTNRVYTFFNTSSRNEMIYTTYNNNNHKEKLVWNLSGLTYNRAGKINRSQVISNVEYLFRRTSGVQEEVLDYKKWDEEPDNMINKDVRILEPKQLSLAANLKNATEKFFNHANISVATRRKKYLNEKNEENILLNLSKDPSILITKPDKDRGTVILDRNYYIKTMESIVK
ncbi:unnamed protein product [Rotaria sp. Silwood2]|nr:unnamed protein product [Rotaria sp. Silwood2]